MSSAALIQTSPEQPLARAFGQHWGGDFRAVGASEHSLARDLFRHLLAGGLPDACTDVLDQLELDWKTYGSVEGEVFLIHERAHARAGRGVFAFRPHASEPIVLQAPHTRNDVGTGLLTGDWMARLPFRAAAWNTLCRRSVRRGAADLARAPRSYFTALAEALADIASRPTVFQIHGYSVRHRFERAAKNSNAIVSSGCDAPNEQSVALARGLAEHFEGVRLFPDDVSELGATCNPVGTRLESRGIRGFVHLELSRALRHRLRHEDSNRAAVGTLLMNAHKKTAS